MSHRGPNSPPCPLDRSAAEWRDLRFAHGTHQCLANNENCHLDRSAAEWRDLHSARTTTSLNKGKNRRGTASAVPSNHHPAQRLQPLRFAGVKAQWNNLRSALSVDRSSVRAFVSSGPGFSRAASASFVARLQPPGKAVRPKVILAAQSSAISIHQRPAQPLRFVFLLALATTLAGCRLPGKPSDAPEVPRPEAVLSFDKLYGENCAACHGANGNHGAAINLANPEYEAWIDDATLRNVIANGEKGVLMPGFSLKGGGNLTDQQIDVLVHGLRTTWAKGTTDPFNGATPPPYHPAIPGNPANGQAVYTAACARCHGADAHDPGRAGSVLDGSFLSLINEQTIRSTIVPGRPDIGQPDWRNDIPRPAPHRPPGH